MRIEGEADGDSPCVYLEWDSVFFGRRIGRVRGDRFSADAICVR
jgi:hypothetical protein